MNINRAAPVIALGDTCHGSVTFKDFAQVIRDVEQLRCRRVVGVTPAKHRQHVARIGPHALQPLPQFVGNFTAKRDRIPFPVLFVGGVQPDVWEIAVEVELPNGQRCEFVLSQPGRDRHFVNQLPLLAEPFLLSDEIGVVFQAFAGTIDSGGEFDERQRLVAPRRTAAFLPRRVRRVGLTDGFAPELGQRSQASHDQQFGQLRFGQCSTLAATVGTFVSPVEFRQRIERQPIP
ncbi:MAG: hypothetical protein NT013_20265 [Planctomycetia bacterium]|nr:hypothetical protein [Planctomycetia bacterium]